MKLASPHMDHDSLIRDQFTPAALVGYIASRGEQTPEEAQIAAERGYEETASPWDLVWVLAVALVALVAFIVIGVHP